MTKLTEEAKEYIIKNLKLSNRDLKKKIRELFRIDISHEAIDQVIIKIQENKLEANFPTDKDLLGLVGDIYYELRLKISSKKTLTDQMVKLVNNRYRIQIIKIFDQYNDTAYLDLLFIRNKVADGVLKDIINEIFEFREPNPTDFKEKDEYEEYMFDRHAHNLAFYEYMYKDPCEVFFVKFDFQVRIPSYLLRAPIDFLTNDIIRRYFITEQFDGKLFQMKVGMARILSYSKLKKERMVKELRSLKSLNRADCTHERKKGELIGECFNLLGFETIITDMLKETGTYPELENIQDVDVIAFSFATRSLILIEEKRKFKKKDFYKIYTHERLMKVFPFLGKEYQWEVTHLFITSAQEQIKTELTDVAKDKNFVFWDLKKFKSNFLPLFNPDLQSYKTTNWISEVEKERSACYEDIFLDLYKDLLGKAKRPIFHYNTMTDEDIIRISTGRTNLKAMEIIDHFITKSEKTEFTISDLEKETQIGPITSEEVLKLIQYAQTKFPKINLVNNKGEIIIKKVLQ